VAEGIVVPLPVATSAPDAYPPRLPIHEKLVRGGGRNWWLVFASDFDIPHGYPGPGLSTRGWYVGLLPVGPGRASAALAGPFLGPLEAHQALQRAFPRDPEAGRQVPCGEPREGYKGDPRSRRAQDYAHQQKAVLEARKAVFYERNLYTCEIRCAERPSPGTYWALSFHDPNYLERSWLELRTDWPEGSTSDKPEGLATLTLPDGRRCHPSGILTVQRNGRVRRAWRREQDRIRGLSSADRRRCHRS
jgi:hypothetical protein